MAKRKVKVKAKVDVKPATKKAEELTTLLEKANSLADELAKTLKNLEIDFKI